MHSYLLLSRNAGLEVNADPGADHEGVGDVAGAAGPDDVLQAGLEEVRRVLEAEGVVPLKDRLLVRNRSHAQCDKKYSDIEAVAALRRTASAGRSGGRCDRSAQLLGPREPPTEPVQMVRAKSASGEPFDSPALPSVDCPSSPTAATRRRRRGSLPSRC